MRLNRRAAVPLSLLLLAGGCLADGETMLEIERSGAVAALLYVDRDGNGEYAAGTDGLASSVTFAVVRGGRDTVATATTDAAGVGVAEQVPVGRYDIRVSPTQLGDSLEVAAAAPDAVVPPNDTTVVFVPLQYATRTVRQVRESESVRVVALEGVALNAWGAFGDSSVHVADSTGTLRVVRVASSDVAAGDSVRVVGRGGLVASDRVLTEGRILITGSGAEPEPLELSTREASSANEGAHPAALVRIEDARVVESRTLAGGDVRLQVDDGSGELEVLLDRHAAISSDVPLVAGAYLDVTGLLVPLSDDEWQLKPRGDADVEARVPAVTIAEARAARAGEAVTIEGVALNDWDVFGDSTVHLTDGEASIRVRLLERASITPGDSIRFVGTVGTSGGEPLVTSLSSTELGRGSIPVPGIVSTAQAAEAGGGTLDAALVKVLGAEIDAVQSVSGETRLVVDDGSGQVTVVLDDDAEISGAGYTASDTVDVEGVLVPAGTGTWLLKPRSEADIAIW